MKAIGFAHKNDLGQNWTQFTRFCDQKPAGCLETLEEEILKIKPTVYVSENRTDLIPSQYLPQYHRTI